MATSDFEETKKLIRHLPLKQREAFDHICVNAGGRWTKAVLQALLKKELIEAYDESYRDRFGPYIITRYRVISQHVHYAWCVVSSEECREEEDAEPLPLP